nr:MAG TPA: hypothetical protein [Caudoviricetes sp.]
MPLLRLVMYHSAQSRVEKRLGIVVMATSVLP